MKIKKKYFMYTYVYIKKKRMVIQTIYKKYNIGATSLFYVVDKYPGINNPVDFPGL